MKKLRLLALIVILFLMSNPVFAQKITTDKLMSLIDSSYKYELTDTKLSFDYADSIVKLSKTFRVPDSILALAYMQMSKFYTNACYFFEALKYINKAQQMAKNATYTRLRVEAERIRVLTDQRIALNKDTIIRTKIRLIKHKLAQNPVESDFQVNYLHGLFIWTDSISDMKTNRKIIDTLLKLAQVNKRFINPNASFAEQFMAKHNLARIYYGLGRCYEMRVFDLSDPKRIRIKDTSFIDSMVENYKKSVYYDNLLHNRQAWSRFTLADKFIKLYIKLKKDEYLRNAHYYNQMAEKYLKPTHDTIYIYQKRNLAVNQATYAGLQDSLEEFYFYFNQATKYNDRIIALQYKYIEYLNQQLKQRNHELKLTIRSRTLIFTVLVILIIFVVIFVLYKNRKILELNRELDDRNNDLRETNKNLNRQKQIVQLLSLLTMHELSHLFAFIEKQINSIDASSEAKSKIIEKLKKNKLEIQNSIDFIANYENIIESNDLAKRISIDQEFFQNILSQIHTSDKQIEISDSCYEGVITPKQLLIHTIQNLLRNSIQYSTDPKIQIQCETDSNFLIMKITNKTDREHLSRLKNLWKKIKEIDINKGFKITERRGLVFNTLLLQFINRGLGFRALSIDLQYDEQNLTVTFIIKIPK